MKSLAADELAALSVALEDPSKASLEAALQNVARAAERHMDAE